MHRAGTQQSSPAPTPHPARGRAGSPPDRARRTRRVRRVRRGAAVLAAVATAAAGVVLTAPPASAGYNVGVKYVDFGDDAHACFDGSPQPCGDADGSGVSNTLYVTQSLVDGEYHYTDVVGMAHDPDPRVAGRVARRRMPCRLQDARRPRGAGPQQLGGVEQPRRSR